MAKTDKPKMTSSAVMSYPQPPLRKAEEYLKAYTTYAYTAISAIAQEVGSLQLKLFKLKYVKGKPETQEIYEHEVLSMLQYVNSLTTFFDIVEATQIYLELTGEAFWILLKDGKTPKEMWLVRPDWMKIIPDSKDVIKGYAYHPGGVYNEKVIIPRDQVIHFKYFNPLNPYRGKGSIQAAALPLDIHTFAQEWNRNFYFNSAIPGLVFTTDKKLNEKVIKRFLNQWQASYGGHAKSNKIAFLGGGLKMDKTTMGAREMDFSEQQRLMRDDVLAVFKVPKSILGLTEDVNRANAQATNKAFMERVITPRMKKFVGCLNEFLLPMYPNTQNLFFDFVDPAPEDVELKLKRHENALKYGWMTPNEVRQEENLEPIEGGDELKAVSFSNLLESEPEGKEPEEEEEEKKMLGIFKKKQVKVVKKKKKVIRKLKPKPYKHMMPLPVKRLSVIKRENLEKDLTKTLIGYIGRMLKSKNGEEAQKLGLEKEKTKQIKNKYTKEEKDIYWRQYIKRADDWEAELKERAIDLFKEQENLVLDRLNAELKDWKSEARIKSVSSILPALDQFVNMWMMSFIFIIREVIIKQGNYVLDFLGVGGNLSLMTDPAIEYLRQHGAELVKGINETTRNKLKKVLTEGFKQGEGIDKLSNRVKDVFKEARRNRSEMIARTESIRASNFGTVEAYRQSEVVVAKEWLTERDDRACEFCLNMDGKVLDIDKNFFNKGDKLTVGDKDLSFDLLDVGYPPLHPNCRCTTIPVLI